MIKPITKEQLDGAIDLESDTEEEPPKPKDPPVAEPPPANLPERILLHWKQQKLLGKSISGRDDFEPDVNEAITPSELVNDSADNDSADSDLGKLSEEEKESRQVIADIFDNGVASDKFVFSFSEWREVRRSYNRRGSTPTFDELDPQEQLVYIDIAVTVINNGRSDIPDLWISPTFIQKSHSNNDPNKFLRQNLSPKLLTEMHSTNTATKDITQFLTRFFHAQWVLCGSFVRPLVVKSDCAKGICSAVFQALTLDGQPVPTRVTYNNLMLIVLCYAECCRWDQRCASIIMQFVLCIIACLYSLCRPHIVRAGKRWIESKKRDEVVRRNRFQYNDLVVNWLRHATSTITLAESLVNVALVIYFLESKVIDVELAEISEYGKENQRIERDAVLNGMTSRIEEFVRIESAALARNVGSQYQSLVNANNISFVDPRNYDCVRIVRGLVQKAKYTKLKLAYTYCVGRTDDLLHMETTVCYGSYPRMPRRKHKPTEEDFSRPRRARYTVKNVASSIKKKDVKGFSNNIEMDNPLYNLAVAEYIIDEWVKVAPSISCDVARLARQAIDAEVDNSNHVNEAEFKYWKNHAIRNAYSKDPGLFIRHWWDQAQESWALWVDDSEHLQERVNETNSRREVKVEAQLTEALDDAGRDELEEQSNIEWGETLTRLERIRLDLIRVISNDPDRFGVTKEEQHSRMQVFFSNRTPCVRFMSRPSLFYWLEGRTKKPRIDGYMMDCFELYMEDRTVQVRELPPVEGSVSIDHTADDVSDDLPVQKLCMDVDGEESSNSEALTDEDSVEEMQELSDDRDHDNLENQFVEDDIIDNVERRPIMYYDPNEENPMFRFLAEGVHYWREKWDLLAEPRVLPKRASDMIDEYVNRCVSDDDYADEWATLEETAISRLQLSEEECKGDGIRSSATSPIKLIRDQCMLGYNIPEEELVMNSSCSVLVAPREKHTILERLENNLPADLFPDDDDDFNSVLIKNEHNPWLDDVHRHGKYKSQNGSPDSRAPCRRTVSVAESRSYLISDPINDGESDRYVTKMPVYTCREMPIEKWQSRPATNGQLAAVLFIWRLVWPYLTKQSRMYPPNAWQYCIYQQILRKHMGKHRDNFCKKNLEDLAELGKSAPPTNEGAKWSGVENSQMTGTSVIVYTMGNCPMKMVFSCLNPRADGGAGQAKQYYTVCPSFTMKLSNGCICVLDVIDDLLMYHSLEFEGVLEEDNANKLVRVAMVIRRLGTIREFYADTSTIRLTGESLKYAGKANCAPSQVRRDSST